MTKQTNKQQIEALLDEVIINYKKPEEILGENGILKQLNSAIIERVLKEELSVHLGYTAGEEKPDGEENSRNGYSRKCLKSKQGEIEIEVPRDRKGSFEPTFVKKHQRRFDEFDEQIISMYARGMTVRDIQAHLKDIYSTDVSGELISNVTEGVMEEVKSWQNRPLDSVYPIVYMDATHVKVRDAGSIKNKAVHLALGVTMEGKKELLGIWLAQNEGAKFWLSIVTELKNRGLEDIFIACVDGLKGFPEAIESVYPQADVQLCIVHMVRYCLKFVSYKHRKAVATDLRFIYTAPTKESAQEALEAFAKTWDDTYPAISDAWHRNWEGLTHFLAYPTYIRKAIYTTNTIESLNAQIKKVAKNKRVFPNDQAVLKCVYLCTQIISKKWTMPIREWSQALNQFAILWADRFPKEI